MSIEAIKAGIAKYAQIDRITNPQPGQAGESAPVKEQGFAEIFSNAVREVDGLQKQADSSIEGLVSRRGDVTAHDAMIALEQADAAFQLMNNIRAKIIRAYEEVMRTQV